MIKYTQQEVEEIFNKNECVLIDVYKNSKIKIKYKCKCGNINKSTLKCYLKSKHKKCPKCTTKKYTYEYVYNYFKKNNCELLEAEYTNAHKLMKYKCECGNISKTKFYLFKNISCRCKKCGIKKSIKKRSLLYIDVLNFFKLHNCKLLTTEEKYINTKQKLKYICSCGNISIISYNSFKRGHRCKQCGIKKYRESNKLTYEFIKKEFEKNNLILLEEEYINSSTPMNIVCSCGRLSTKRYSEVRSNKIFCKNCRIEGSKNFNYIKDRKQKELNNYIRLRCSSLLKRCILLTGQKKNTKTEKMLGFTKKDLLNHLKKSEYYNEFIKDFKKYHIDHIIPIQAFIDNKIIDIKIINHLSNLQLLPATENLSKGSKYLQEDFNKYIKKIKKEIKNIDEIV